MRLLIGEEIKKEFLVYNGSRTFTSSKYKINILFYYINILIQKLIKL